MMIQGTTGSTYETPQYSEDHLEAPTEKLIEYFKEYARQRPEVVALWAFGIGFVLGWKLKLW